MSRKHTHRTARRHFNPDPQATARVLVGVKCISAEDVEMQRANMAAAIDGLLLGQQAEAHWASMADAANVAETLASMGLGCGQEATTVIAEAQEALAYAAQERQARGTWALRADERDVLRARLQWLAAVHVQQLAACSYAEFERAYRKTADRLRQARAGNAPVDALVVEGLVGGALDRDSNRRTT